MLSLAIISLVIAFIAALFGFTGIAVVAVGTAKLLFFVFLAIFLISLAVHLLRGLKRSIDT